MESGLQVPSMAPGSWKRPPEWAVWGHPPVSTPTMRVGTQGLGGAPETGRLPGV